MTVQDFVRPPQFIAVVDPYIRGYNTKRIKVSPDSLGQLEYRESLGIAAQNQFRIFAAPHQSPRPVSGYATRLHIDRTRMAIGEIFEKHSRLTGLFTISPVSGATRCTRITFVAMSTHPRSYAS